MKKNELAVALFAAATLLVMIYIWFAPVSELAKRERDAVAAVIRAEGATNVLNPRTYRQPDGVIRVEFDCLDTNRNTSYTFGYAEVLPDGSIKGGRAMYVGDR